MRYYVVVGGSILLSACSTNEHVRVIGQVQGAAAILAGAAAETALSVTKLKTDQIAEEVDEIKSEPLPPIETTNYQPQSAPQELHEPVSTDVSISSSPNEVPVRTLDDQRRELLKQGADQTGIKQIAKATLPDAPKQQVQPVNVSACDNNFVGRYEDTGGKWEKWIELRADCTGSFCSQTLNDRFNASSSYGWNCEDKFVISQNVAGDFTWKSESKAIYNSIKGESSIEDIVLVTFDNNGIERTWHTKIWRGKQVVAGGVRVN